MGDLALAERTAPDYSSLEDCPYVDDCVSVSDDYVHVTQLFCDGVGMQYKDYIQSERNLEFDICSMWCTKPVSVLQDYCDAIKVRTFWSLLFQHQRGSIISRLHPCVEAASHASEISLKKLHYLELMEDIMDLAKKVVNDPFFIGGLLRIGYKIENKILVMEEALNWVKYIGDATILPKLGSVDNCWPMLSIFFTEYKYHITKVITENCNLLEEFKTQYCAECLEQGELMKMKGNEEVLKGRFDIAIVYYTRAIEYRPENHLLYGNRALCFLRTGQFRNALGDGKRATILRSNWTKGHYRYCDALSMLGEYDWALQANIKAQKLCKNDPEGIKDLIQQHVKLQKQIEDLQGHTPMKNPMKAFYESRAYITSLSAPTFSTSLNFVETERESRKAKYKMANGGHRNFREMDEVFAIDDCDCHTDFLSPPGPPPKYKGRQKSRNNDMEKFSHCSQITLPLDLKTILEKQFSKSSRAANQDFANIMKMLRSLMQDGYTALLEQRCRSATQSFTELLNGLDPQKIKQLNLAMINYVLVVYGLAISLLGIGQPEELSEAENQFKRMIEHYPNEGLDCLAYCGIGKVYLKKNRFLEALNHFEKAKTLIYRIPGVLTWPTSNVVIEETHPGKIKMLLGKFIEECKFPPVPDATCCYQKCHGYSKVQIYISDPDFKGFIRISCCQYCKIEFHMNCWKKLKTTKFNDKIDKDFLQGICLTPDCEGIISKIIIFSSGGQVKCEFEHKVIKEKVPPRPVLKQKCTSLEKLKLKEDKKLKRKIQKQEAKKLARERMEEDIRESNASKAEDAKEAVDTVQSCQFLDDRILQCIKQYADKIRAGVFNTSKLLRELLSWKVLSTEDYTTCFSSRNFLNEAVGYVIRHLIQEKNRVKTRIFLHVLSELKEVEPTLAAWIQKLNSFGLDAAGSFFTRYGASLKELDLSIMAFLWNEMYGHKLASIAGRRLEHFSEPTAAKEARCLIWLLEEHREKFPALHGALDEFFDIMDSRCTVLRKQDNGDLPFTPSKMKNKGKKKKQKDSKPMLIGSGTASVTSNNETATLGDDHSRYNSNSSGPFVVPEHLRQDVEEFEALYSRQSNEYVVRHKKLWDINPKQKCSTLYDYFSQLLEEHGPLDMTNKIFSEEYEFFPEETQQILEKAGGLKSFLLDCPRFVVIDNCIALKKVASRLKKKRKKKILMMKIEELSRSGEYLRAKLPLNPAAKEFTPDVKAPAGSPVSPPAALGPGAATPLGSEDEKPQEASSSSPKPGSSSGEAAPQRVSRPPKRAPKEVKPTYWSQPTLVTGYCTYLPFRSYGLSPITPAYINVITTLPPQYSSVYSPLAAAAAPYPRPGTRDSTRDSTRDRPEASAKVAACSEGPPSGGPADDNDNQTETETSEQAGCGQHGGAAQPEEDAGPSVPPAGLQEESPGPAEEEPLDPRAKAVQVSWNTIHQEANTEPYSPFEEQLGDMSQIEKEYHVLQRQLKEAHETHEQKKLKTSEEIKDLEEKLTRSAEENKISKTELNWFREDLEKSTNKWQQEKREIQEKLRGLKKRMKRIVSVTEKYTQGDDEKPKILESLLDQSLDTSDSSNAFADEKIKIEESIKKGKESYQESLLRAVAAEVSVLENRKGMEVGKLQAVESQAEAYLQTLQQASSESEADPELESDVHSWESFLSDVRKEIEKVKLAFEDQMEAIRSGAQLSELPPVQVSELSPPAYSTVHTRVLSESSDTKDQAPSGDADTRAKTQTAASPGSSGDSAGDGLAGNASPPPPGPVGSEPEAASPPRRQSPPARQNHPAAPGRTARSSLSPKKPFNSIMEHLSVVFPCYTSTELAGFVKKVRSKNKNSLSGLSVDEIVQRVTGHILEEVKPNPGRHQSISEPQEAPGSKGRRSRAGPAPSASCELCGQAFRSRKVLTLECGHRLHRGCFKQWLRGHSACPACLPRGSAAE